MPRPTVFLVDDDAAFSEATRLLLELEGYAVEAYPDGEAFLAGYRPGLAGCVLLDQGMPGLSGLQVQQALHALGARIPVIFLTGRGDPGVAESALGCGAFDFLPKPVSGTRLLASVARSTAGA